MAHEQLVTLLGTQPDTPDSRDFKLSFKKNKPTLMVDNEEVTLPITTPQVEDIDIRKNMPVIYDQGAYPHCASYAVSSGLDFYNKTDVGEFVGFAEPWLYDEARKLSNISKEVKGVDLRSVLKLANKTGSLPRREWSYVLKKPKKADKYLLEILTNYKIQSYATVNHGSIEDIKKALRTFGPVYVGLNVYSNWRSVGIKGNIEMPGPNDYKLGGHGMVVVGYKDKSNSYIVRNSWGNWGDNGHCYIPHNYFLAHVFSCWTAVDIRGSKDLYDPTEWEKFRDSKLPKGLKKAFGIPF